MFRRSSAVEQFTVNQLVVGAIPTAGAIKKGLVHSGLFLFDNLLQIPIFWFSWSAHCHMQGIPVFISQRIRDAPICFFFVYPTWLRCMFVGCWTPPPLSRPERSAQHVFQTYLLRAWGNSWIRWTWQQCCNQHCPWIKWMKILIGFVILNTLATPSFSTTKQMPVEQCQEI